MAGYQNWVRAKNDSVNKNAFTEFENRYMENIVDNYNVGIAGLTSGQTYVAAVDIMKQGSAGNMTGFLEKQDQSVIAEYQKALPSLSAYMSAAAILEGAKNSNGES